MLRTPVFHELMNLRDTMDQFFRENPFGDTFGTVWSRQDQGTSRMVRPRPLDIYATDENIVILAAVTGMRPEDLELTIHRNTVTISGELHTTRDVDEAGIQPTWYTRELLDGSYRRSVTLPFAVDADHADATFEHGILRVVIPKAEDARPKKVAIQSGERQAITSTSDSQRR